MINAGRLATWFVAASLVATAAAAQPRQAPVRATRGPQFSANVYGGWDAPLFDPSAGASLQPTSQWYSGADAGVSWNKVGQRLTLASQVTLSNRYYPNFTPSSAPSYGGTLALSSTNRGRWQWGLSQFAHYAPFFGAGLFAAAATPSAQSLQLANATAFQQSQVRQVEVNTAGSLSYSLSRRTTVAVSLLAGRLVPIDSPVASATRLNGDLRVTRGLTRTLSGYFGYSVAQNRVSGTGGAAGSDFTLSGFDFGVNFDKGLQITRNTTLNFRTGLVNVPQTNGKVYQLTGGAALDRSFRNGWQGQLVANRDARFVQTYRNAVVYSGISAQFNGPISGPLGSSFSANYSSGTINAASNVGFSAYSATAQLRYDVKRRVATFVEYSAFYSSVDTSAALPGLPTGEFGRHSVRGGLSFGLSPFGTRGGLGAP
jgi:hypothetical protein